MSGMRKLWLTVWALLFLAGPSQAAQRLALLIGNGAYDEKIGRLTNPINDIELLAAALEKLGFKVTKVPNANSSTMHRAVREHANKVRTAGSGTINFFYYSGHGAVNADTNINYVIPVNVTDADDTSLWVESVELKTDIIDKFGDQAPEATHLVVIDACRNELKLRTKDKKAIEVDGKGFVPIARTRILIAYSTEAKRTASDAGVGSGPYARILAEELVLPGIEVATMFRTVQLRVQQSIGQYPYYDVTGVPQVFLAGNAAEKVTPPTDPSGTEKVAPAPAPDLVAFERERASQKAQLRSLLQQIGEAGIPRGGVFHAAQQWRKRSLVICFMDGNREQRVYVASVARQWTLYGEIEFDFGSWDEPRLCSPGSARDVAVTVGRQGNWAFVGTNGAIAASEGAATVSLQTIGQASTEEIRASKFNREVLHQFGHVLGFDHNWKAPAAGISCVQEFDWDHIYQDLERRGWSRSTIDVTLRGEPSPKSSIVGAFDKSSVMNFEFPASYFVRGRDSPCYLTPLNELSLRDKVAMFTSYK